MATSAGTYRKILAVIPIRKGSKGVRDKNIRDVAGRPLFAHMLNSLIESRCADRIIVSTDDENYASLARQYGAETPFLRPASLADGRTRLHYVMQHALQFYDEAGERFDAVLSAQATAPLVRPSTIRSLVHRFNETGANAIGTGTEIVRGHPYLAKIMSGTDDRVVDFVSLDPNIARYPRQVRPTMYSYDGALFLRDRGLVLDPDDDTNALGHEPRMLVLNESEGMSIDSEEDFDFVRFRLERSS